MLRELNDASRLELFGHSRRELTIAAEIPANAIAEPY